MPPPDSPATANSKKSRHRRVAGAAGPAAARLSAIWTPLLRASSDVNRVMGDNGGATTPEDVTVPGDVAASERA